MPPKHKIKDIQSLLGKTFRKVPVFWKEYGMSHKKFTVTKVDDEISMFVDEWGNTYPIVTEHLCNLINTGALEEVPK